MSKNIARKIALVAMAATTAVTLSACADKNADNEGTDDATASASSAAPQANGNDSQELKDAQEKSDDKNANQGAEAVTGYYKALFTDPIEGGEKTLEEAQQGMIDAVGGDSSVFDNVNPRDAINSLSTDKQEALVKATEQYSEGARKFTNYDDVSNADKATFNIVALMFRASVANAEELKGMDIVTSANQVKIDGDKGTVPSSAIVFSIGDETQSGIVTMDTPLIKESRDWKIDTSQFIDTLLNIDTGTADQEVQQ